MSAIQTVTPSVPLIIVITPTYRRPTRLADMTRINVIISTSERGWYQRTTALQMLRNNTKSVMGTYKEGVVYFGDDDNSYDTRLFTDYIRHVKKLGMWAVGLAGGSPVESPEVVNGTVVGYKVKWGPKRKFAVDMAGFAINLDAVLNTTAVFGKSCRSGFGAPEPCFLEDMGFSQNDIEPVFFRT
ncbi:glycosyltransferase family 43 [Cooperia oncophora]